MTSREKILAVAAAALFAAAAVCFCLLVETRGRLADCRASLRELSQKKPEKKTPPDGQAPSVKEADGMEILGIEYSGGDSISICFSKRPDMDSVRRYVRVPSLRSGALGFRCGEKWHLRGGKWKAYPELTVTGDFLFGADSVLEISKGLPAAGAQGAAEPCLAEGRRFQFARKDLASAVKFAFPGRYLPSSGKRLFAIDAVNATNVHAEIRRVEPRNIVQLLAREERVYKSYYGSVDSEDTEELSGASEERIVPSAGARNEKRRVFTRIAVPEGSSGKGVFLLSARVADFPRRDWAYGSEPANPEIYRLVCVSDLALSVRRCGADAIGVWVVSLLTGRPVEGARIEVYSSSNTKVREGVSDSRGWCEPARVAKGESFAVVASAPDGSDMTFLALADGSRVGETMPDGARDDYLAPGECAAFLWTERGIYRHGEKIFLQAILRDSSMSAPKPFPVEITLAGPKGDVFARAPAMPDSLGALSLDTFSVPDGQPGGKWTFSLKMPGDGGRILASKEVRIEEFAPPQIRVKADVAGNAEASKFSFRVSAEHLFGGAAKSLRCEGAVVFEDEPFAPAGWKGYVFGNDDLGLKAAFRRLPQKTLGSDGSAVFSAPLRPSDGRPKAAVKATVQGVVFEDGGRPAAGRASAVCHVYPFYIGAVLPGWVEKPEDGVLEIPVACVMPDGSRAPGGKKLSAKVESVESIFAYESGDGGWGSWTCERVRAPVADGMELETLPDASSVLRLDLKSCGDYVLTVSDPESGASFSRAFFLGDGAEETSAPLGNPAEVVLVPDKAFYRPGETPRILVRSPFAGTALVSVVRDRIVSVKSIELGTATGEIVLDPVDAALAPSVDVAVAVVKPVAENNDERMAVRAHGAATLSIRPAESELSVTLAPKVEFVPGGAVVTVAVDSSSVSGGGKRATITVVDEGINLLSGGNEPDPSGFFARPRSSEHPLYDMYGRILPVDDDVLRASGMKTGGGFGASLFARVSPVPTRRFKPLSLWKKNVSLENGKAEVEIRIPEFSGEVRVTALVYSASATGAASVLCKVSPRLVAEPDAPRFVAPGDEFEAVLPLRNTSDSPGRVKWSVSASGEAAIEGVHDGEVVMAPGESVLAFVRARALGPGQAEFGFSAEGLGERHEHRISLPVRPAVPWRETVKVLRLEPGEKAVVSAEGGFARHSLALSPSRLGELSAALGWLADYPHGCLEQTVSRIFPLVAAGGALNAAASGSSSLGPAFIAAGIGRVESMIREHDFSMWPDCDYAPWDREVSLYAAHFLVEAEKSGRRVSPHARKSVLEFLGRWASSTNAAEAAYACHTLALAGVPDKDRMFSLYDNRADLGLLSRSRLARAFSAVRDRKRAEALLSGVFDPQSVEEAAFAMLALLETNPSDGRVEKLKAYLESRRDRAKFSWGTTHANAHALIALGEYFRHNPVKEGLASVSAVSSSGAESNLACGASAVLEGKTLSLVNTSDATAFLTVRTFDLPAEASGGKIPEGLSVSCRFFDSEGREADLGSLVCGELLVADIAVTSAVKRVLSDLVVENLFAGAFEPVLDSGCLAAKGKEPWVMRSDARDDRMLVFSKKFTMEAGSEVHFRYPVRVVSAGRFVLPGPALEGMYDSSLDCRRACSSIVVRR